MKKSLLILSIFLASCFVCFAQVSDEQSEQAFKIMESTDDVLAYHGDYSATISLVIEKPGKPKENLQFKFFERLDKDMFTMVQLFPEADKGCGLPLCKRCRCQRTCRPQHSGYPDRE